MADTSMWGPSNSAVTLTQNMQLNNLAMQQAQANIADTQAQVVQRQQANQAQKLQQQQQLAQQAALQKVMLDQTIKTDEARVQALFDAGQPMAALELQKQTDAHREKQAQAVEHEAKADEAKTKTRIETLDEVSRLVATMPETPEGEQQFKALMQKVAPHLSPEAAELLTKIPLTGNKGKLLNLGMQYKDQLAQAREEKKERSQEVLRSAQAKHALAQSREAAAKAEAQERLNIANKKNDGGEGRPPIAGVTGEEYLATLDPYDARAVKAIAKGDVDLNTYSNRLLKGMNRTPRETMLRQVQQYDPNFSTATAKEQQATKLAFDTKLEGRQTRAINVAINHAALLGPLHEAMRTGDKQLINKLNIQYQKQFGKPAPTSFEAVAEIYADEVTTATLPAGTALADRQATKEKIKAELSNAQLKGVTDAHLNLMAGKLEGLEQTYLAGVKSATKEDFENKYLTDTSKKLFAKNAAKAKELANKDSQLSGAEQFLRDNPNDPRAPAIRKRLEDMKHGL